MTQLVSAEFEQFIARHFGADGRAWLERLPARVDHYRRAWQLDVEQFFPGGLMSCCLAVTTADRTAAVLKLSGRWTPAEPEAIALGHWAGGPAPALLAVDAAGDALLIERVVPGDVFAGVDSDADVVAVARLIRALHAPSLAAADADRLPRLRDRADEEIATAGAEAAARSAEEAAA
ncbi:MAG: aminoglycoside phosphotransferase family protein, partial [Actinomycetota bacterium]|nr:aminoglycoside phosphotransferase family protein [Actinomycetota bacterium]